MNNAHDYGILMLKYMLENNLIAPRGKTPRELGNALGLSDNDIDIADDYLLQSRFIEGGGGLDGIRWLTPFGVMYITEELKQRLPMRLDSERILKFLIQEIKDNKFLTQDEILKGVHISPDEYNQACQQLMDFDFVELFGSDEAPALIPTKQGRQAVHRNFQEFTGAPSIQAGAIFTGPVSGGNIQAVASAINSEIKQDVSSLSPEQLQEWIQHTLEDLLGQIEEHLSLQQKAAYAQLAAEFQKETTQPKPDTSKLQNILAGLGLLSDLGGTIDLGQKTFALIVKAGPYIMMLGQLVAQVIANSAH